MKILAALALTFALGFTQAGSPPVPPPITLTPTVSARFVKTPQPPNILRPSRVYIAFVVR